MKTKENHYYVPGNQCEPTSESIKITNLLSLELIKNGKRMSEQLFNTLINRTKEDAHAFSKALMFKSTTNNIKAPLFKTWENNYNWTWTDQIIQLQEYKFKLTSSNIIETQFLDDITKNFKNLIILELDTYDNALDHIKNILGKTTLGIKDIKNIEHFITSLPNKTLKKYLNNNSDSICITAASCKNTIKLLTKVNARPIDIIKAFAYKQVPRQLHLPRDTKFGTITWQERKGVIQYLNTFNHDCVLEAMSNNKNAWKKFITHTNLITQKQFIKKYPGLIACLCTGLKSNKKYTFNKSKKVKQVIKRKINVKQIQLKNNNTLIYRSYASRLQTAVKNKNYTDIKMLCMIKPTHLFRNIQSICKGVTQEKETEFLSLCTILTPNVNTNVIMSILKIDTKATKRIIDAKGNTLIEDANYTKFFKKCRTTIKEAFIKNKAINYKIVIKEHGDSPISGNSNHSQLTRGQKTDINKAFLYNILNWKNGDQITDLDLSMSAIDKQDQIIDTFNYSNQRGDGYTCSGDITDAPVGASEYNQININKFNQKGIKYLVPTVNVYQGNKFQECEYSTLGWNFTNKSEFTLPKTINKIDLVQGTFCIPYVIDIETKEIIAVEYYNTKGGSTIHCELPNILSLIQALKTTRVITYNKMAKWLSTGTITKEMTIEELNNLIN